MKSTRHHCEKPRDVISRKPETSGYLDGMDILEGFTLIFLYIRPFNTMEEDQLKQMAAQLRQPNGEYAIQVGVKMNEGNLQMNRDTLRVVNPGDGEKLLEIGMGNGGFVKGITENKPLLTYTGCDLSQEMVEEANRINADLVDKGQVVFVHANATSLPLGNETFDKIFTANTIYFWDDETIVLKELKRVLKPEGKLILSLRPRHQMEKYPFTKYGFNMFSKQEICDLLESNGFKPEKIFENNEPEFELNGEVLKMENLIVVASKK